MEEIEKYIIPERLYKIKAKIKNNPESTKTRFRSQIIEAIKEELSKSELNELETLFDADINKIANYVALTYFKEGTELAKKLNISIDEAILRLRGVV